MATVQSLLNDIKLRYRHTYTNDQVLVWLNDEQRELFEMVEIESEPAELITAVGIHNYDIPPDIEIEKIKTLSLQISDCISPTFKDLDYKLNDNHQYASYSDYWYTIVSNQFFINIPGGPQDDRSLLIYFDREAMDITASDLNSEPSTPVKFQEILKLGTLKRIAQARKDVTMANNFDMEHEQKITDYLFKMKVNTPEFYTPSDMLPRRGWR